MSGTKEQDRDEPEPSKPEKISDLAALNLSATKGRPVLFVLMTCGFIACMACVLGTFAAVYFIGSANDLW